MTERDLAASAEPGFAGGQRPTHLTSFFGREREIAEVIERLLERHPLLTITGPGGVGKTRLALAVIDELERRGAPLGDPIFISLAPLTDESLVLPSIARALGIVARNDANLGGRLTEALRNRRLLLVIDNFEHLLGASLDIATLLATESGLSLIVTSRRALRLRGEQEYPLSPLAAPVSGGEHPAAALRHLPAVQLFLARATAANPRFELTEANASAIARICTRLDGLPLAIELAAARVKLLSPQALAARLSGSLQLLTTGPRDVPRRQQTLRDAIAWSHDLLAPAEQTLFRRLAVFAGGATLDAVETVSALGPGDPDFDPLDTIAALVDHSLIVQDDHSGESRFRMLETIREYALELLAESGEAAAVRDRHAAFFARLAVIAADTEYGSQESALLAALAPELDNVRAALTWLIDEQPAGTARRVLGLRLTGAMVRFWDVRGYLHEESEWLHKALAGVPEESSADRGVALTALGVNAWFASDLDEAERWQEEALAIWRALDVPQFIVRSLWFLGMIAAKRGQLDRLNELADAGSPIAPELGASLWAVVPNSLRALAAIAANDGATAEALLTATAEFHLRHGYQWPRAWVTGLLGQAALLRGDRATALRRYQRSLREFHRHGDIYATLDAIVAVAARATEFGQPEIAANLLGAVAAVRPSVGKRVTWNAATEDDVRSLTAAALSGEAFAARFAAGRELSPRDAVELALSVQPVDRVAVSAPAAPAAFGLSPRELEVLKLLADGKSNQEIGEALYISPRTAGTHVANILGKLDVNSRSAAVAVAMNAHIV